MKYLLLFFLLVTQYALAASFDCIKASRAVDIAICQDESLSNLDTVMASYYYELLSVFEGYPKARAQIVNDQRGWLRERDSGFLAHKSSFYFQTPREYLLYSYVKRLHTFEMRNGYRRSIEKNGKTEEIEYPLLALDLSKQIKFNPLNEPIGSNEKLNINKPRAIAISMRAKKPIKDLFENFSIENNEKFPSLLAGGCMRDECYQESIEDSEKGAHLVIDNDSLITSTHYQQSISDSGHFTILKAISKADYDGDGYADILISLGIQVRYQDEENYVIISLTDKDQKLYSITMDNLKCQYLDESYRCKYIY